MPYLNIIQTIAREIKILAFKLKTREISKRNHTTFLIILNSHKETQYEETYFIKVLKLYVL